MIFAKLSDALGDMADAPAITTKHQHGTATDTDMSCLAPDRQEAPRYRALHQSPPRYYEMLITSSSCLKIDSIVRQKIHRQASICYDFAFQIIEVNVDAYQNS